MKKKYTLSFLFLLVSNSQADALSLWLMNTRCDCSTNTAAKICGTLLSADGYGRSSVANSMVLQCTGTGDFGTSVSSYQEHEPVYNSTTSCYGANAYAWDYINLTSLYAGFFVFAYDPINRMWTYLGFAKYRGYVIPLSLCAVDGPGCQNWTFDCRPPNSGGDNPDIPIINGGGACAGKSVPAEVCGSEINVIWDDKATCDYHCRGCDNALAEWQSYCAPGTLSYYGAASDCNYYCDCAKGTAARNQACPFGANVNQDTCRYVCKPCVQKEIECENTCQASTGALPVENQCQETVLGTPYEAQCTCGGGATGGTGGTGEECPYCDLLPQIKTNTESIIQQATEIYNDTQYIVEQNTLIKHDTEAILSGQQDVVDILGQLYDISQDHFFNNERLLGEILAALNVGGNNVDVSPVVNAVDNLHGYFNTLHDDLRDLKSDLHTALYGGGTPYLESILAEMRRISKGLLDADSGAQTGSLVGKMQGAIYLDATGNWAFRSDITVPDVPDPGGENGTSFWDYLLAAINTFAAGLNAVSSLMNAYFAGETPAAPVYSDWDLTELGLHNDPAYQAAEALAHIDVPSAASSSASRYNSLPRPSISLLNPNPCVVSSSSGLSICFNTDVWQSLYVQLKLWGYFFAHLTSFVLVYRARTGISPSLSSDDE
jgi:hypothetical protein